MESRHRVCTSSHARHPLDYSARADPMTTPSKPILSHLLYVVMAAGLGAFIATWVEPTWQALVHGERYDRPAKSARIGGIPLPSSLWVGTGAAIGLVLGLVGRPWRVHGMVSAAIVGAGVGVVAGGAFATTSPAIYHPPVKKAPNRYPYWDASTRQLITERIVQGAWIGVVTGLLVGWYVRKPRTSPIRAATDAYSPFGAATPVPSYALAIDLDAERLRPDTPADQDLRRVLQQHGFDRHQGGVHYGGESVTAVTCVLAAQDLARSLPWFAASARQVRMLRVGESDDLMPAVQRAVGGQP
jgi:virulence-associated protein VapD